MRSETIEKQAKLLSNSIIEHHIVMIEYTNKTKMLLSSS